MGGGGGKKRVSRSTSAGLHFDVRRISRYLNRGNYADVIARNAPVCLAGILQYLAAEVLQLAGNAARDDHKTRIVPRHINLGLKKDKDLRQLFGANIIADDAHPLTDNADALPPDPDALSNDADALYDDADAMADKIADTMADKVADEMADKIADEMADDVDALADGGDMPNLHNSLIPEKTGGGKVGSTQADARCSVFEPCSVDVFDRFEAFARDSAPSTALGKDIAAGGKIQFDWKEALDAHIFKADLPGMLEEEVKIRVEDGRILQISGVRSKEEEEEDEKFHLAERARGRFVRCFRLPENAVVDEGNASMENGVLTVKVPKQPH